MLLKSKVMPTTFLQDFAAPVPLRLKKESLLFISYEKWKSVWLIYFQMVIESLKRIQFSTSTYYFNGSHSLSWLLATALIAILKTPCLSVEHSLFKPLVTLVRARLIER